MCNQRWLMISKIKDFSFFFPLSLNKAAKQLPRIRERPPKSQECEQCSLRRDAGGTSAENAVWRVPDVLRVTARAAAPHDILLPISWASQGLVGQLTAGRRFCTDWKKNNMCALFQGVSEWSCCYFRVRMSIDYCWAVFSQSSLGAGWT